MVNQGEDRAGCVFPQGGKQFKKIGECESSLLCIAAFNLKIHNLQPKLEPMSEHKVVK